MLLLLWLCKLTMKMGESFENRLRRMALEDLCFCGCFNGTDGRVWILFSHVRCLISGSDPFFHANKTNCCAHNCSAEKLASSLQNPPDNHRSSLLNSAKDFNTTSIWVQTVQLWMHQLVKSKFYFSVWSLSHWEQQLLEDLLKKQRACSR